jgi:arylsulfatase
VKPNIIYILTDDLGYGELGCYGQTRIQTPNIDRMASEGIRFTQHYSGSPVCAPSRCVLLTGKHTGHSYIRDNHEIGAWDSWQGQLPLPDGTVTVGHLLQDRGYATACIGKWGLGRVGSPGEPARQGFDLFYGYNCQRHAHNYYPRYLWRNDKKETLEGNDRGATGRQYAPDLMAEEALSFIRQHRDQPFFLYFATPVPHVALQVPEDSVAAYQGRWPDPPYDGDQGYLPHPTPRAAYAAMVSRLDRDVGRILSLLKELDLDEQTLVMFSSDNGPTFNGGSDSAFFESAGPFRGLKCDVYEGGIRVPLVARWPGRIKAGTTSDHPSAFWDVLPTFAELAGAERPLDLDGHSLLPTLRGRPEAQEKHDYLYWEYAGKAQAVRKGEWKAVRERPDQPTQVYHLGRDPGEQHDGAAEQPEILAELEALLDLAHTPSAQFPLVGEPPSEPTEQEHR